MSGDGPVNAGTGKFGGLYDAHGEKLRFLVVGVWNTAFSYALFWVMIKTLAAPLESATGFDPKAVALVMQWVSWVFSVVQSTVMMKYFVFHSAGRLWPQVFRAYFVYLPAQGLASLTLFLAMQFLGMSALMGQLLTVFVTTIFSYLGHKHFTFRTPRASSGPDA